MNQVNERTNRRTNRQLVREGRGKSSGARKRLRGARPRKGLASCNYGASATPALSPIIRMRFQVRLSDPLGVRGPRESHREASRPKRPYKPRRYGARKEEKMLRERERKIKRKGEKEREWSTDDPLCGVCRQTPIDFTVLERCLVLLCDRKSCAIRTVACLAASIARNLKI